MNGRSCSPHLAYAKPSDSARPMTHQPRSSIRYKRPHLLWARILHRRISGTISSKRTGDTRTGLHCFDRTIHQSISVAKFPTCVSSTYSTRYTTLHRLQPSRGPRHSRASRSVPPGGSTGEWLEYLKSCLADLSLRSSKRLVPLRT
jgi:hypothetical protein